MRGISNGDQTYFFGALDDGEGDGSLTSFVNHDHVEMDCWPVDDYVDGGDGEGRVCIGRGDGDGGSL